VLEVLIVDDDAAMREAIARLLAGLEWVRVVGAAASVAEALAQAEKLRPQVVLMDVTLPDGDGFTATERLIAERSAVRVIMLTLHDRPAYERRARAVGARAFVAKTRLAIELEPLMRRMRMEEERMVAEADWRVDEVTRDMGERPDVPVGKPDAELERIDRAEMAGIMALALANDLTGPILATKREAVGVGRALDEVEESLRAAGLTDAAAAQLGRARNALLLIDEMADFMRRMARDVVRFQRHHPGEGGVTDVRHAVATAVRYANTDANVPIAIRVPRDLTAVVAEHTLVRVLVNLIRNAAAAFTPSRNKVGWIVISAARIDDEIAVEVTDDAGSVPANSRQGIFDAFARGTGSGPGLGLSVGRALLRDAGGDLELIASEGNETRFRVTVRGVF
jgi:DNA-binding NarL/FixJ family response regulator